MDEDAVLRELSVTKRELTRLQAILASTTDAVIGASSDGTVWEWNRAAEAVFGFSASEVLGTNICVTLSLSDEKNIPLTPLRLFSVSEAHQVDAAAVTHDKQSVPIWLSIAPVPDFNEERRGFSIIARDMSDRKAAEKSLKQSLADKEALLREVHHRVKNNLQVICSMLRLQASYLSDGPGRLMFKNSEERVQAMGLVHEQLYSSKNSSAIDMSAYVASLAQKFARAYGPTGAESQAVIATDLRPVSLPIDRAVPFGLMVSELLSNALNYGVSSDGVRRIRLALSSANDMVEFGISDQGKGLPSDVDTFHPRTLGLRLVHALCQQLHGRLVYTREGGSRFVVEFPSPDKQVEPEVVHEAHQHPHL